MYWDETYWSQLGSASNRFVVNSWQGSGERSNIMSVDVKATVSDLYGEGENPDAVFLGVNVLYIRDENQI